MGTSEFVDLIKPGGDRLKHYDRRRSPTDQPDNDAIHNADPARAVPEAFIDAMIVREEVFVKEQNGKLENEVDEDDARSFHWVAYASIPAKAATTNGDSSVGVERRSSSSTKIPIGTIRLVPPPHPPLPGHDKRSPQINGEETQEAYIKLAKLAVIKEFRKAGISKLLIETALSYARNHPYEVGPQLDPASMEALKKGLGMSFKGLVLVHSPLRAQKLWRKYGFELDKSLGTWDEGGIESVAMWRRLDVSNGRRQSKIWLASNPLSP